MNAIRVSHVSKKYRRFGRKQTVGTLKSALLGGKMGQALSPDAVFPALSDVSFEVAAGSTIGVIGENGSGKSTLLKLLAGIFPPTSGSIECRGRVAALIELGAGFHPEITARENIEINGMLLGFSRREIARRFDSIVEFAGIGKFLDEPIKTFSSGMVVRLGFSIAAHVDPDILLVDEVLAVGDASFTHRCLERIAEFQRSGKTIVVVSHDLALVAAHCPRVLRLAGGHLVSDAPAAETIGRYREEVAAAEEGERFAQTGRTEKRWGSGSARIDAVRLLGPDERETRRLRVGEAFTVEISGTAFQDLSDFVAGVFLARVDGTPVFGTNTAIDGLKSESVTGPFSISLAIDRADLAPGAYSLDVAVHAADGSPYDYRVDVLRFDIDNPATIAGIWSPPRRWDVSRAGRWKR